MNVESRTDDRVSLEIDPSYSAGRLSLRPIEYRQHAKAGGRVGGHYRLAVSTGLVTGVAAGGALFSLQWTNADRELVLLRALVSATLTTAFAAAQESSVDICRVSPFTAPNTGGSAPAVDGKQRAKHDMQPLGAADLRVATTAALAGGTGSEELAFGAVLLGVGNTANNSVTNQELYNPIPGHEHPQVFRMNEGFRIRNLFAQGADGVIRLNFTLVLAVIPSAF